MNILDSEKGSAEIVGNTILFGLTITGMGMITLFSVSMINGLQDTVNIKNAEQIFDLFDSRATGAILGDLAVQTAVLNLGGGVLEVEPNSTGRESYMVIKLEEVNDVIKIPMGKVTYHHGDSTIAYEGGGVWLKYPSSGSAMLSPPKFSYNGVTLTIPGINIRGNGSAAGKGFASVSFKKAGTLVLYPDASIPNRTNPVYGSSGDIYVNVTSDFYDAWAEYARGLGYTSVSTNSTTRTASIRLSSVSTILVGKTPIFNPFTLRGIDPGETSPMKDFSFWLVPYGHKFDWDIHASSGKKKLIFHIKGEADDPGDKIDINVGYQDTGSGYIKSAETWKGDYELTLMEQEGNLFLDLNLLSTGINLIYDDETVGAGSVRIHSNSFNTTGFSWGQPTQYLNWLYKWFFNTSKESWVFSNTTNGTVTMSFTSADGNVAGSIYSKLEGGNKFATTTWTSPNFTWTNGTPMSVRLDFNWKVAAFAYGNPGSFNVTLVKPSGTSVIFPTTTFSETTGWSTRSNSTVSVNDFTDSGNYSIKLTALLSTQNIGGFPAYVEVRWDNPTITIDSTVVGEPPLTSKSLFDITQHYIGKMAQEGDISFYQGYSPGKQPSAESTMLINYSSTRAPIYLYVSQNNADVSINI